MVKEDVYGFADRTIMPGRFQTDAWWFWTRSKTLGPHESDQQHHDHMFRHPLHSLCHAKQDRWFLEFAQHFVDVFCSRQVHAPKHYETWWSFGNQMISNPPLLYRRAPSYKLFYDPMIHVPVDISIWVVATNQPILSQPQMDMYVVLLFPHFPLFFIYI